MLLNGAFALDRAFRGLRRTPGGACACERACGSLHRKPVRDPDNHDTPDLILEFGGSCRPNPHLRVPGPFPHKSLLGAQISNKNGAAKRPRFGSRFLPQVRICVETGQDPGNAGLGARDPIPRIKSDLSWGSGSLSGSPHLRTRRWNICCYRVY